MQKILGGIIIGCLSGVSLGCIEDVRDHMPEASEQDTGVALSVDFQGGTDVAGFSFSIADCESGESVLQEDKNLEDLVLPGMIPGFVDAPFDGASRHHFADYFASLAPGCYDITAQPIRADQSPSQDCAAAKATEIFVVDNMTTELVTVAQCQGEQPGAVDVVAGLNHPPRIDNVEYSPSKFTYECEKTDICVTATDIEGDPVAIEFEKVAGKKFRHPMEVISTRTEGNSTTSCVRIIPIFADDYLIEITAYDMGWDDGKKVAMSEIVGQPSQTQLTVPMYTNWDFELECYDENTDQFHRFNGVRQIDRHDDCQPIWPEQYYCSEYHWDDTERTCPNGEFQPQEVYPSCEDHQGQYVQ